MQNAPSVVYPVGRCAFYARLLMVLAGLSGGALVAGWWHAWAVSPSSTEHIRWALGGFGWLIWLLVALRHHQHLPSGMLKWDAQMASRQTHAHPGAWLWLDPGGAGGQAQVTPEIVLDGQNHLLIRLIALPGVPRWLWLERSAHPGRWDDLRRALVATR